MHPRLIKEIRVVLPAFGLTLSMAVAPLLIVSNQIEGWVIFFFVMGCLFMGALAFGIEFQHGTMNLLLTQPRSRSSIWREKMAVLGVALALCTVALCTALLRFRRHMFTEEPSLWIGLALVPLCALCATPLLTLLSRSILAGVLTSFSVPFVLLAVNSFVHRHGLPGEETSAVVLLIGYCGVSCWLGYRRFERLQVVDMHSLAFSQEMAIPARVERVLLRPFQALSSRFPGMFAALLKKELRLQLVSFVAAAVFCVVVILEAVLLALSHNAWEEDWAMVPLVITFYFFVLIFPLIVGTVSVAEEKAWGVADWHVTLPPSLRKQWAAKMLVTLSTSLLLGLLLPSLLILGVIGLGSWASGEGIPHKLAEVLLPIHYIPGLVLAHVLITSVAIYAAGLTSSTARGILLAFGMYGVAGALVGYGVEVLKHPPGPGMLTLFVVFQGGLATERAVLCGFCAALLLLLCVVQRFAFVCYRERRRNLRQLIFQAVVLCLSVFFLAVVFLNLVGFGPRDG